MNKRLYLEVNHDKFISEIIENKKLSTEWVRNLVREETSNEAGEPKAYCFDYIGKDFQKSTITFNSNGSIVEVSNIGPKPSGSMNLFECNALLTNFIAKNLVNISHKLSLQKMETKYI